MSDIKLVFQEIYWITHYGNGGQYFYWDTISRWLLTEAEEHQKHLEVLIIGEVCSRQKVYFKKLIGNVGALLLWLKTFKTLVKYFLFSKVAGSEPAAILKSELLHRYLSTLFTTNEEWLFSGTRLFGCFCTYDNCFNNIKNILHKKDNKT